MKIATILGARPQFIKAAVVSRVFAAMPDLHEVLIHTGQHYDDNMSQIFFRELALTPPHYNLGIGSGSHGVQTGRMLTAIEHVLLHEAPDWVLVYGDTNSTLAGALASRKLNIPVIHVEAGLRSFDRRMPEEVNRILTDHSSDLLFAPAESAVQNLVREGIAKSTIHDVGDVMYDAAVYYSATPANTTILDKLQLLQKNYILLTLHRSDNTDDKARLWILLQSLRQVADERQIVFPIHPRMRHALNAEGLLEQIPQSVKIIDPVGYLDMLLLEKNACLIATDSGGVQKEAYFHRVPCLVLREATEWVELLKLGCHRLVPLHSVASVVAAFRETHEFPVSTADSLYGNAHAAERIAQLIVDAGAERDAKANLGIHA